MNRKKRKLKSINLGTPRPFSWVRCAEHSASECPDASPNPRLLYLGPIPNQPGHVAVLELDDRSPANILRLRVLHSAVEVNPEDV